MEGTVDRDGGFFFEVVAETRVELVHRLDDAAQVLGLDLKFTHPTGVTAAEPGGKDDARGRSFSPCDDLVPKSLISARHCEEPTGRRGNLRPRSVRCRRDCFAALAMTNCC